MNGSTWAQTLDERTAHEETQYAQGYALNARPAGYAALISITTDQHATR